MSIAQTDPTVAAVGARPARVVVISSGHVPASSTARLGTLLGQRTADLLGSAGVPADVDHLELRTVAGSVTEALVSGERGPEVVAAVASVQAADALVLVTPTINASFSGLLKCFLDVLPMDALRGVPTVIGATGGTQRHTLVLDQAVRPMLAFLRAVVLPTCLFVTADEWDGALPGVELGQRVDQAADELATFCRATSALRVA